MFTYNLYLKEALKIYGHIFKKILLRIHLNNLLCNIWINPLEFPKINILIKIKSQKFYLKAHFFENRFIYGSSKESLRLTKNYTGLEQLTATYFENKD